MTEYYDWKEMTDKHPADMYMVVSARGVGKTYGLIKLLIDKLIKEDKINEGPKILYLRRNKNQIQEAYKGFWDAFKTNNEWPGLELTNKGNIEYINKNPVVEMQSLTDDMKLKGNGHSTIEYVIFDEFIPGGGGDRYKKNETKLFQSILSSYGRDRELKYFLLANSLSYESIYFDEFGLRPKKGQRFNSITYADDVTGTTFKILIDHPLPGDIEITKHNKSKLSVLFSNTSYGNMAINNEAPDAGDFNIRKRDPRQSFVANIKVNYNTIISVWLMSLNNEYYAYFDLPEKNKKVIALTSDLVDENSTEVLTGSRTRLSEYLQINLMRAKDNEHLAYRNISTRINAFELMREFSIIR